ncbi:fatty acyl-CoA reductase wat-like [Musca autumnalis]|uniref:fatty acyl-CoA reductase wat-like n=1 Tax=Musca autumnalis TaxID=221902 RepID=UPI003CF949C1
MSIETFYKDKEIFITGGTGFIGKVLIEKILYSLPNVSKLYILMRTKKNKSPEERLKELLEMPVFRRVRNKQQESFKKITIISGDCYEKGLGISAQDKEKLRNVSIIFHVAATVRFDEDLKSAILLNTRGAYEMVKLAQELPKMKAFVHVSTAYCHPDRKVLDEKIYPPYADWRNMIKLAETCDVNTLNILFPKISSNHPNTYTFTKSLAEHVINDHRDTLPIGILRPSIVISSYEEPMPGWVDNINGPIGMLVASGTGLMRTSYGNPNTVPDVIPVDMCATSLLVAAFKLGTQPPLPTTAEVEIFNCCNSSKRYLSNDDILTIGKRILLKVPFDKCLWLPEGSITSYRVWHYFRFITLQIIPAIFLDLFMIIAGKKPMFIRLNRRIVLTSEVLKGFLNNEWTFLNDNFRALEKLITENEWSTFNFLGYCDCNQEEYYCNAAKGVREFLLNESAEPSSGAILRIRILRILHYSIQLIGGYYIIWYIIGLIMKYLSSYSIVN